MKNVIRINTPDNPMAELQHFLEKELEGTESKVTFYTHDEVLKNPSKFPPETLRSVIKIVNSK